MTQLTPFTFVHDWYLNCQFAGLIWAKAQGLYRDAGLDVTLVDPHDYPHTSTLDVVLSHGVAAGCMEDNLVVRAALAGQGVRAIGAMLQQTPMVLMTRHDSGLRFLHDLPGRHIAMHADGIHLLRTILTLHEIDQAQVDATIKGWTHHDLLDGRFEAVQGYTITEPAELRAHGLDPFLIPVRHHQLDPYAQMMFATTTTINAHGDVLQRFMDASLEGWRQALTHRTLAAELIAAVSKEQTDPVSNRQVLDDMVPIVVGDVGLDNLGYLDRDRWNRNLATYHQFGMVERLATFDDVADDRFLKSIG